MKIKLIGLLLPTLFFSGSSLATEYIYRDLMANTLPSAKCENSEKAQQTAAKPYNIKRYSKKFCQTQGYGWHVEEVKSTGTVACNQCADDPGDLQSCHLQDVVVTCKRIKPGTVGMLPGQG